VPYPDKLLANDEKIVEHLHPHWITLVPATLWFLVVWGAAGAGVAFAPSHGTTHSVFVIVILVVAFVLFCYLSLRPWIGWRTTHYVFTDHRVLIRRGVLRRTGRDIGLSRISDVGFSQSLLDRMVNAGTLTIESAGEQGQEPLANCPRSDEMQQTLNRLIEADSDRRAGRAYGQQGGGQQPGGGQQQGGPGPQPGGQYPPTQQYPQQ
jgi:uncharacterized membrane protein YdbT with pleckstrin-like domain